MAIDRNRGTFVQEEYRYETAEDSTVKTAQPQARVIKFDTNLNLSAARLLADEILAEQKFVAQAYSVTFEGVEVVTPSDLDGSPPTFLCNFPDWPVELTDRLKLVSFEVNYKDWVTTVLMKGAMR